MRASRLLPKMLTNGLEYLGIEPERLSSVWVYGSYFGLKIGGRVLSIFAARCSRNSAANALSAAICSGLSGGACGAGFA